MNPETMLPPPAKGTTPFEYALSLVGGKWRMPILFLVGTQNVHRYGELKRNLHGISSKVLSEQLDQLEQIGLLIRQDYSDEMSLHVEYELTDAGHDFMPVLMEICRWGKRCGWENMTAEQGWKNVVTVWDDLREGDDAHFPTPVCRRVHTPVPSAPRNSDAPNEKRPR